MQNLFVLDLTDKRIQIIDSILKEKGEMTADIVTDDISDKTYRRTYVLSPRFQELYPAFDSFAPNSKVFYFILNSEALETLARKNCKAIKITDNERFNCINSRLTAEGALLYALQKSDVSLKERKVLIIGFGHLGKALLQTFQSLCPHLTVAARNELARCEVRLLKAEACSILSLHDHIDKYDLILNTVPAKIFDRPVKLNENVTILELASKVYPFEYETLNVDYEILKSLPSKAFPVSAAHALLDVIVPDLV